jgi:hypothetical protein
VSCEREVPERAFLLTLEFGKCLVEPLRLPDHSVVLADIPEPAFPRTAELSLLHRRTVALRTTVRHLSLAFKAW